MPMPIHGAADRLECIESTTTVHCDGWSGPRLYVKVRCPLPGREGLPQPFRSGGDLRSIAIASLRSKGPAATTRNPPRRASGRGVSPNSR